MFILKRPESVNGRVSAGARENVMGAVIVFHQGLHCTFQGGVGTFQQSQQFAGYFGRLQRESEEDQQKTEALQPSSTVSG